MPQRAPCSRTDRRGPAVRHLPGRLLGRGCQDDAHRDEVSHDAQGLGVIRDVRLSGKWFVHHLKSLSGPDTTDDRQSLALGYTDWEGKDQVAWLIGQPQSGYRFVGISRASSESALSLSTCRAEGVCWTSTDIRYVGPDGGNYVASVVAGAAP